MRIENDAHRAELPGLEVDFERGEVSFEWEAMLASFYREAALLARRNDQLAAEAMQWYKESKPPIAGVLHHALKDNRALWIYTKKLRCDRVKSWHRHGLGLKESSGHFDDENNFEDYAHWRGLIGWTEDRFTVEDNNEEQTWRYQSRLDSSLYMMEPTEGRMMYRPVERLRSSPTLRSELFGRK